LTIRDPHALRPAEVAEAIGVSRSKAYELIASGAIPSIRFGASVRVPVDLLKVWIASQVTERQAS
jgi:excisionase family DNA binding protein